MQKFSEIKLIENTLFKDEVIYSKQFLFNLYISNHKKINSDYFVLKKSIKKFLNKDMHLLISENDLIGLTNYFRGIILENGIQGYVFGDDNEFSKVF